MIDKKFCEIYVSLIPRPERYATEMHMISVVEKRNDISNYKWFTDEDIKKLCGHNRVSPQVYSYIRDNKSIWVNKNN